MGSPGRVHLLNELKENNILSKQDFITANELLHDEKNSSNFFSIFSEETLPKVLKYLSEKLKLEYTERLPSINLPQDIIVNVDPRYLKDHCICPYLKEDGMLFIAVVDPLNLTPAQNISLAFGYPARIILSQKTSIMDAINQINELRAEKSGDIAHEVSETLKHEPALVRELTEDLLDMASKPPVIKLVNSIIYEAIKERATDIHIQPMHEKIVVKYRIDGLLHEIQSLSLSMHQALVSRIKIMSQLDIAERRRPQDGRMSISFKDRKIDIRVSILPLYDGERVVLRVLDKSNLFHNLTHLGLEKDELKKIREAISYKHGLLFVSGPTGSGKTTTLYACLSTIDATGNNIITIEDPIEYLLDGISQMQVSVKGGFKFSDGLRSVLRHDPDIIMVGEVRDLETAQIAVRASLTGHLVLSTLHTNDAAEAVSRLIDLGTEPYLITSSLSMVIAQRLVRRICSRCKEEIKPTNEWFSRWGKYIEKLGKETFSYGKGCSHCHNTGYSGRIGIFEILPVNENIRKIIREKKDSQQMRYALEKDSSFRNLLESGLLKVAQDITTVEEVFRVVEA